MPPSVVIRGGIRMSTMMTRVDPLPSTPPCVNFLGVNRGYGNVTHLTSGGSCPEVPSPVGAGKSVAARLWGMHPVTVFET
ncbi:hypothetical protein GCM10010518_11430 [Kitasatospora cinereorecta]